MQKFDFSFECSNDPLKMPIGPSHQHGTNNYKTRHCNECSRNIVDLTKLTAKEIVDYKKNHKNPCGFMMPWQIDQVNEYLQNNTKKSSSILKYAKIAAVVGSPFLVGNVHAQKDSKPTEFVSVNKKPINTITEVLLKDTTGQNLSLIDLTLFDGMVFIKTLKTDNDGKIYLNHTELVGRNALILKNTELNIEKPITLRGGDHCIVWETKITKEEAEQTKEFDLQFVFKNKKNEKPVKHSKLEIDLFDSTNTKIEIISCNTNFGGYTKFKTKNLNAVDHFYFVVYTNKGRRTSYKNISEIADGDVTKISFYQRSRRHRNAMVRGKF